MGREPAADREVRLRALLFYVPLLDSEIGTARVRKLRYQGFSALQPLYLLLEEAYMRRDFTPQALHFAYILFCLFELPFSFLLPELKGLKAERVLKHRAALARMRDEDTIRFALGNNMVAAFADIRTREEFLRLARGS